MAGQLKRKLKAIRRRLQWIEFCRRALLVSAVTATLLFVFVVVSRLFILPLETGEVIQWVELAAIGVLLVWAWMARVKLFNAAVRADESLGLKERLSSALMIGDPKNEPEMAVLEDATRAAESIKPGRAFPMQLTREFKFAAMPLAALALAWWLMPQFDLLAKVKDETKSPKVVIEAKKQAAEKLEELAKEIATADEIQKPELAREIERELTEMARQLNEQKLDQDQAMAKLAKMTDKLEQRKAEIERELAKPAGMEAKGEGKFTGEMEKALQKGNFEKAAKLMAELKEKVKNGELSEEEKSTLQKELKMMAAKLGEGSPLAESLENASEKMSEGEFNSALADLELAELSLAELGAMLSELKALEALEYDMDARNLALSGKPGVCQSCGAQGAFGGLCGSCAGSGTRPWSPGDSREFGNGMGGPGIGRGSIAQKKEGQIGLDKSRIKGDVEPGKIIAKFKVSGEQAPGEIATDFEELRLEYAQKAEDTIEREAMPLEYKSFVRDYFDAIKSGKAEPEAK